MLADLTREHFAPHVGEAFRMRRDPVSLELVLTETENVGSPSPSGGRQPFSLVFTGPHEPLLPQRTYHLEHGEMGRLDLFLVPIGIGERGAQYEAVFT